MQQTIKLNRQLSDDYWIQKNRYYYQELSTFYQFVIPKGYRVLQIGCRSGYFLNAVKPSYGVGIDTNEEHLNLGKTKYPWLNFYQGTLAEIAQQELKDQTFDYIILAHTLMKEYDIQSFLEQLHPFCTPQTRVVLNNGSALWEPLLSLGNKLGMRRPEPFKNWISLPDLENLLDLAEFETVHKGYQTLLLKYVPLLSFFCNKILANLPLIERLCFDQLIVAKIKPKPIDPKTLTCSVIIPCRNERGNIEPAVQQVPLMGAHTEIIFVEGHSKDGSFKEMERVAAAYANRPGFSISYEKQTGKGKGNAVFQGFNKATGDIVMIQDGDITVAPTELPKFFNALAQGKGEFINGVRLIYSMESGAMRFLNLIANKIFGIGFSWLLRRRIKDTLCGTKVLWRKDWKKIEKHRNFFGDFDPFGDFDLLFGAAKQNLKIVDMPVHYKDRSYGTTQISRFRHGLLLLSMSFIALKKFKLGK